jgi:DNA primase
MAGRIPSSFIDELLVRADIVDVIDSRVQLKKTGHEYQACCPFHNEKTPSFTVSPDKQFYRCFGCGAHGSALGFLMDYEHMAFVEAVEELASGVGMEVPREKGKGGEEKGYQALYDVMEKVTQFYTQQLRQHPEASRATDYLKNRGLSGEIAAQFEVGFVPQGWDNLKTAMEKKGVSSEQLVQVGMLVKKDGGGFYDRFRDRIMFPIRDTRGRVIAFGGRQLDSSDAKSPKYLNSSETPIFHKGRELYGLYQARKADRKLDRLLVVEGYMDVVSLAQFGVSNAVATLGTATTKDHLERLFRVVPQAVFCFDGDRAGRQAAWRALENALPVLNEGRQINFMFLPDGEDPDSLVRQEGKEAFEKRVAAAIPFSDYFFGEMAEAVDISSTEGRARLVEKSGPLLSKLPDSVFRHMMTTRLAEIAHIEVSALSGLSSPITSRRARPGISTAGRGQGPSSVRQAIRLLLHKPALVKHLEKVEIPQNLELPGLSILRQLVEFIGKNPHITCGGIVEHWREEEAGRHLAKLAAQPLVIPEEGLDDEFSDVVSKLASQHQDQLVDGLLAKAHLGDLTDDEKQQLQQALTSNDENDD